MDQKTQDMKRFQLHLSTLLLLTILAGGFVWLNVQPLPVVTEDGFVRTESEGRGFPFKYDDWFDHNGSYWYGSNYYALALNCMIGLAALSTVGWAVERIIRQRKL